MSIESERLLRIEHRLSRLEAYLSERTAPKVDDPIVPSAAEAAPPETSAPKRSFENDPASWRPTPQITTSHSGAASEKSGNWLGIIGIICFVLAAAFIVKLSIESGWLTPERQVGLAAFFGFALIGSGFALLKKDREYASLLPGAGIVVLYLSTFAAHLIYPLISFETAIAITSVVSCMCILLYTKIRHDIYPITASIGAYASPVILGVSSFGFFSLYYFVVCSLAFSVISIWVESRTLTVVSAYLAILLSGIAGYALQADGLMAGTLALHVLIFSLGTYFHSRQTLKPLTASESWCFLPVLILFYCMEYFFIDRINPELAPWLSLIFAGFLLGLYLSAKSKMAGANLASGPMVLSFVTGIVFHSVYLELLPGDFRPWLFVIILVAYAVLPAAHAKVDSRDLLYFPRMALLLVLGLEFISIAFHLLTSSETSWTAVSLAGVAALWGVIVVKGDELSEKAEMGSTLLAGAHALAILGLYRLTKDTGSLAVSASWLAYACAVLAFAYTRRDKIMVKSAMLVLGFAAAKALLYDAASAPTLVRIFCLLLTGVALYGSGYMIRRIQSWK